jgi:hypothetical protein
MKDSPTDLSSKDFIQIAVPAQHVIPVYAFLAKLEHGAVDSDEEGSEIPMLDRDLVVRMFAESEDRHRHLLLVLADNAGKWMYTTDIADGLGITSGSKSMAGMFGAFGRRAKHRYDGLKPWDSTWDNAHHEARYKMDPQVAVWVLEAAKKEGPPWS